VSQEPDAIEQLLNQSISLLAIKRLLGAVIQRLKVIPWTPRRMMLDVFGQSKVSKKGSQMVE
jgi:hypothetical protein